MRRNVRRIQKAIDELIKICDEVIETDDGTGRVLHKGLTMLDCEQFSAYVPKSFIEVPQWRDGRYRACWVDYGAMQDICYCEGDVIVCRIQASNPAPLWREYLDHAAKFYGAPLWGQSCA